MVNIVVDVSAFPTGGGIFQVPAVSFPGCNLIRFKKGGPFLTFMTSTGKQCLGKTKGIYIYFLMVVIDSTDMYMCWGMIHEWHM